jgi:hypothetical protein
VMLEYLENAKILLQVPYPQRYPFRQNHGRYFIDPLTRQVRVLADRHPRWKDPKPLPSSAIALGRYYLVSEKLDVRLEMTSILRSDGREYAIGGAVLRSALHHLARYREKMKVAPLTLPEVVSP